MPPPMPNGQWIEIGGFFNVPRNIMIGPSFGPEMARGLGSAYIIGFSKQSLDVIAFSIASNGTLVQPPFPMPYMPGQQGYMLSPGQTATLTFNGTVGLGDGLLSLNFTNGAKYRIEVIGSGGAYAQSNVSIS